MPDASRKIPEVTIESLMKKAIEYVTRTHRGNNKHKASVCVICDRVILGTKPICKLTKDRIMLNEHRLSVQMLEDFIGDELNDILKKQYQVDGLEGILLSPRAHRDGDSFDSCHSCEVSLRPNQARKSSKPPKYAIANGFAIGYIPRHITTSGVWTNAKGEHVEATLPEMGISGLMSAAISKQRPYGYCFSFSGGADRSVVGHYQFFETNQETVGSVINHFRSTGANSHILCVLCGKFTPSQRQIARDQCRIDTNEYIALITWLIKVAKHPAYVDLTPPDDCPAPNMLDQEGNQHNTDESQNPSVEDQFSGGTFTFTSPHDPTENNGVYRDNEDFTMAVLNRTAPILLVHGGNYVNTGKELKLESVFPSQFPFGLGGPKSSRPTHISEEACLKHYLHLSLNQFMRSEFILVVYHLYNRIMSFRSGLITGRGGIENGQSFAELVSTLTEEEITAAAARRNNNKNNRDAPRDLSTAGKFFDKVETSCKAIGHSAAAAKHNKRLMFSMCDWGGIPDIFFTLTPCDECTHRVRIWANCGEWAVLPALSSLSDHDCFVDFKLRSDAREKFPGACSLEYQSIVDIAINVLFGWDANKQEGGSGIVGELKAWAVAHEEQGRKTLHGHYHFWVKFLRELKRLLFGTDLAIREEARRDFKQYVDKVMSASYNEAGLTVLHECVPDVEGLEAVVPQSINADEIFYDHNVESPNCGEQLQTLRDARNKKKKDDIQGKVIHCRQCGKVFSTQEIVNMALDHHKKNVEFDNHSRIVSNNQYRIDIAAYRYTYDYQNDFADNSGFWANSDARLLVLRKRFDEHDHKHRKSCFKKGDECRANLPKESCEETILFEEFTLEDAPPDEIARWYNTDGSYDETVPYLIQLRRNQGSQFLNTHSVPASTVFSCNTNVQIGSACHIFYTTNYAFKDTSSEDSERFIRIGTQVQRRLLRLRRVAAENEANSDGAPSQNEPSFSEGLSRILSGIMANMSKACISAPMAHFIVCNDGSRFQFSHKFAHLLVSQMLDVLDGKEGHFRVRTNYSKTRKQKVLWADSAVDDYLHRPMALENCCLYDFISLFEKVCKKFKQMNDEAQNNSDFMDNMADESGLVDGDGTDEFEIEENSRMANKLFFLRSHPGYEFSYLQKRKHVAIPIISMPKGNICRIEDLEIGNCNPNSTTCSRRDNYAKTACVMFLPFRDPSDLMPSTDASHWMIYQTSINENLFCQSGFEVLRNIEEREAASKARSAEEPLKTKTTYQLDEDDDWQERTNRNDDTNATDLALYDEDEERQIDDDYQTLTNFSQRTRRTNDYLIDPSTMKRSHLIPARLDAKKASLLASETDETNTTLQNLPGQQPLGQIHQVRAHPSYPTLLTFISGTLVGGNYDDIIDQEEASSNQEGDIFEGMNVIREQMIPTLIGVARKVSLEEGKQLDKKQFIAYEIIACSFLLSLVEDGVGFDMIDSEHRNEVIKRLKDRGGQGQLIMFLTGFAGAGKSTCIKIAQRFCYEFCRAVGAAWDDNTFLFTATTGSAAGIFGGRTIHDAAFLSGKEKNISRKRRDEWQRVKILIIDEISFFTRKNLEKLDRHLKNLLGRQDKPFGGIHIVFSGDFHQLRPVKCEQHGVLFEGVMNGLFEGSINTAIFLENSHRFHDDPDYGELLKRFWLGKLTEEDIDTLNSRLVGQNGVCVPKDGPDADIRYACPFNKQRNAASAGIFKDHILSGEFPTIDSDELPPEHTVIIEADIHSTSTESSGGKTRVSQDIRDRIINTCGDSHVRTSSAKKIDPALRMYTGAHAMCTDNSKLKQFKLGNGTLCRVKRIKLKIGSPPLRWKNWEGKKVHTTSARFVEWVEFDRFPVSDKIKSLKNEIESMLNDDSTNSDVIETLRNRLKSLQSAQTFRLNPVKSTATVDVSLDDSVNQRTLIKQVVITQIPVNMNDATTGHKLQGMSVDNLLVASWSFMENWIYVVLSRVRTLKGLFLLKALPKTSLEKFGVPPELKAFEYRMRQLEACIIASREKNMAPNVQQL